MLSLINRFPQIVRYLIVAVLAYLIDMGGYILLLEMSVSPVAANVVVKIFAALFGFFAHRFYTYQLYDWGGLREHAIKYFSLVLAYAPTSSVALYGAMLFIPNAVFAKFFCDVILFILVYWVTTKFTFLKEQSC